MTATDRPSAMIYTDGGCIGNPGPGGYAALILIGDQEQVIKGPRRLGHGSPALGPRADRRHRPRDEQDIHPIGADMPEQVATQVAGNIWKILVNVGDQVRAGDTLFILELMKTEVPHLAGVDGRLVAINIAEGDTVDSDVVAVLIE